MIRGVIRTQSNIYDGSFLRKQLAAFSRQLFLETRSIVDVRLGSKYAFDNKNDMPKNYILSEFLLELFWKQWGTENIVSLRQFQDTGN